MTSFSISPRNTKSARMCTSQMMCDHSSERCTSTILTFNISKLLHIIHFISKTRVCFILQSSDSVTCHHLHAQSVIIYHFLYKLFTLPFSLLSCALDSLNETHSSKQHSRVWTNWVRQNPVPLTSSQRTSLRSISDTHYLAVF